MPIIVQYYPVGGDSPLPQLAGSLYPEAGESIAVTVFVWASVTVDAVLIHRNVWSSCETLWCCLLYCSFDILERSWCFRIHCSG